MCARKVKKACALSKISEKKIHPETKHQVLICDLPKKILCKVQKLPRKCKKLSNGNIRKILKENNLKVLKN